MFFAELNTIILSLTWYVADFIFVKYPPALNTYCIAATSDTLVFLFSIDHSYPVLDILRIKVRTTDSIISSSLIF